MRMHALMGTSPVVDKSALAHSTTSVSLDTLERTGAPQVSLYSYKRTIRTLTSYHSDLPRPLGILKVTWTAVT